MPEIFSVDDSVRPVSEKEKGSYTVLSRVTQTPASLLATRWREPSLTVHNVGISGPKRKLSDRLGCFLVIEMVLPDSTVISSRVRAHVSFRIVPDQDLETIGASVREHLVTHFG